MEVQELIDEARIAFEKRFGEIPRNCQWLGNGYCQTNFNAWEAGTYSERFEGFLAAWKILKIKENDMELQELVNRLQNPELMCYSVVVMALKDTNNGDYNSAIARLRIDADKIRTIDKVLYLMLTKGE